MKTLLLFFLLPLNLLAQDIAGVWTGFIQTSTNTLPYELAISETKEKLTGFSLTIFTFGGIENTGIKSMKIKKRKGGIYIEDDELIYDNYSMPAKRVVLISSLSLTKENSIVILAGTFITRSMDRTSFKGKIRLEKKADFFQTKLISKLNDLNVTNTLSFIHSEPNAKEEEIAKVPVVARETPPVAQSDNKEKTIMPVSTLEKNKEAPIVKSPQAGIVVSDPLKRIEKPQPMVSVQPANELGLRKTEILNSFFFESDSLTLSLYDNGEIDGDTVSVVLNDKVIIAKKRLSVAAITTTIYIPPGSTDSLRLIMYAENLGTIPPNTGLLIIQDKNERHEIRFAGDLQKNSGIILRRKK